MTHTTGSAALRSPPRRSIWPRGTGRTSPPAATAGRKGGGPRGWAVQSRPMIRRLFAAVSVIFLMMCIGALVLWVRSYSIYDSWFYFRPTGGFCELSSGYERICLEWGKSPIPLGGMTHSEDQIVAGMAPPWGKTNAMGFRLEVNQKRTAYGVAKVDGQTSAVAYPGTPLGASWSSLMVIPYWGLCLPLAAMAWSTLRLSRRSAAAGRCLTCGYDLRASKNRCPECGTPIPVEARA